MRKNCIKVSAFMIIMIVLLGGCGSELPDMTQEEEQVIGEYAAKLLLKYDANNRSRLVSRELVRVWESDQAEEIVLPAPEPEKGGMEPVEDTPIVEIGQETAGITTGSIEAFYQMAEGVKVTFTGYEVCDSYSPDGDVGSFFTLDAENGNKLLVLKFDMENQTQTEQKIDMLSRSAKIQVSVNGGDSYKILMTMLMNDMTTYMGTISAGQKVSTVMLTEVDVDVTESISSLSLNLKNDSNTCTIQLQ